MLYKNHNKSTNNWLVSTTPYVPTVGVRSRLHHSLALPHRPSHRTSPLSSTPFPPLAPGSGSATPSPPVVHARDLATCMLHRPRPSPPDPATRRHSRPDLLSMIVSLVSLSSALYTTPYVPSLIFSTFSYCSSTHAGGQTSTLNRRNQIKNPRA
jgi:hypothetical protein